ncbi:MAG: heavy-metal-associated domain-containing protein [Gemmataceae bacterium]
MKRVLLLAGLGVALLAPNARADTTVVVKGTHLCCPACVNAVAKILKDAGCQGKCDQKGKTITITAADDAAAAKAVAALAAGGFHGQSDNDKLAMKDDSGAKKGKVKSLEVSGVHNCCGACCKAIKAAIAKVDGFEKDTATPKQTTFTVTGNFEPVDIVKALNDAGFHVKVK